jgi:Subtilase family/Peptidase inhibitor I9
MIYPRRLLLTIAILFIFIISIQATVIISSIYFGQSSLLLLTKANATIDKDGGDKGSDGGGGDKGGKDDSGGDGGGGGDKGGKDDSGGDGGAKDENKGSNTGETITSTDDSGRTIIKRISPVPGGGFSTETSVFDPTRLQQGQCDPATDKSCRPPQQQGQCDPATDKSCRPPPPPPPPPPPTTLTIKKIDSYTKKLIPDACYMISPDPQTLSNSFFVRDNDNNDFNHTKGVVLLKNPKYSVYTIQVVDCKLQNSIIHQAKISIHENLPHFVLNIVENSNLGKLLPEIRIPFQYIVALKNNVKDDPESIAQQFVNRGAELIHTYRYSFNGFAIRVPNPQLLNDLIKDPKIAYVEQDKIGYISSTSSPSQLPFDHQVIPTGIERVNENVIANSSGSPNNSTDDNTTNNTSNTASAINPLFSIIGQQQQLQQEQPQSLKQSQSEGLEEQGDSTNLDINADIAVLDTGISESHPDLNVYKGITLVKDASSADDDNGHGSHVAGTIAAKNNSIGVVGVAPGARLWAVKVCDSTGRCPISNQIKGIDYVMHHADEIDIVNISIENHLSALLDRAVSRAVAAGITVIASAGNHAKDANSSSPAHNPDVISVSAIADSDGKCGGLGRLTIGGADDRLANFSNYGSSVDIAAPGVDILSTFYNDEYGLESGTSMAAPHVAGYAALYKAHHPLSSPAQVRSLLINTASLPATLCDGKSHGYFFADVDRFKEPLLYVDGRSIK